MFNANICHYVVNVNYLAWSHLKKIKIKMN